MDVIESITSRRSIHSFQDIPVEKEKWGKICEMGNLAPCAGNIQNWKFIVVQNKQTIEQVALASYQQEWITTAPLLIVVTGDTKYLKQYYGEHGSTFSIQNCAAAMQNMMLAAHQLGLGSCWVGAMDKERVAQALFIPQEQEVMGILAMGYPNEEVPMPPKQVFKKYLYVERFGSGIENIHLVLGEYSKNNALAAKKHAASLKIFYIK